MRVLIVLGGWGSRQYNNEMLHGLAAWVHTHLQGDTPISLVRGEKYRSCATWLRYNHIRAHKSDTALLHIYACTAWNLGAKMTKTQKRISHPYTHKHLIPALHWHKLWSGCDNIIPPLRPHWGESIPNHRHRLPEPQLPPPSPPSVTLPLPPLLIPQSQLQLTSPGPDEGEAEDLEGRREGRERRDRQGRDCVHMFTYGF